MQAVRRSKIPAGHVLRETLWPQDEATVRRIVESSGFFSRQELEIAVELVRERRARGEASGYQFLFVEPADSTPEHPLTRAYCCYGEIACTVGSYDLYWIAVDHEYRSLGIGRGLLQELEAKIKSNKGRQLYIETSGRPQYAPTRSFYLSCGFRHLATFPGFYGPTDAKEVYGKELA
jgi:ribosomal protein S18 acetylase RimI-like enzyme